MTGLGLTGWVLELAGTKNSILGLNRMEYVSLIFLDSDQIG